MSSGKDPTEVAESEKQDQKDMKTKATNQEDAKINDMEKAEIDSEDSSDSLPTPDYVPLYQYNDTYTPADEEIIQSCHEPLFENEVYKDNFDPQCMNREELKKYCQEHFSK